MPEEIWPELKTRVQASYQAPSRKIARELAEGVIADYERDYPSAVACFMDDFEACIAHLRLPIGHRRATRTTNLLERLFVEERRRLKIIPNAFGEKAVLKLMFAAMTRAAERWRAIKVTEFERRQMAAAQRGTRQRVRCPHRTPNKALEGKASGKFIQQESDLTELIYIAMQMLGRHLVINALVSPLHRCPKAFQPVRVGLFAHIFAH